VDQAWSDCRWCVYAVFRVDGVLNISGPEHCCCLGALDFLDKSSNLKEENAKVLKLQERRRIKIQMVLGLYKNFLLKF
jgi:predicted transcriptional regulator